MPTPATKRCGRCQQELPLESFSRNRATKDGHSGRCKACVSTHYKAHAAEVAAYQEEYRRNNAEKLKAYSIAHAADKAARYKKNAEAIKARTRARRKAEREAAREAARAKQSKVCPSCDIEKSIEEFGISARYIDGHNCYCRLASLRR